MREPYCHDCMFRSADYKCKCRSSPKCSKHVSPLERCCKFEPVSEPGAIAFALVKRRADDEELPG